MSQPAPTVAQIGFEARLRQTAGTSAIDEHQAALDGRQRRGEVP
jgi:hypothetical protein